METHGYKDDTPDSLKGIIDILIDRECKKTPMTVNSINYYRRYASQIFDLPGRNGEIIIMSEEKFREYLYEHFNGLYIPNKEIHPLMHSIFETTLSFRFGEDLSKSIISRVNEQKASEG